MANSNLNTKLRSASLLVAVLLLGSQGMASSPRPPNALPLPPGVPQKTHVASKCFAKGEVAQLDAYLDSTRIPISGCASGVLAPVVQISSALPYDGDPANNGSVYSCENVRNEVFRSRALDRFTSDLENTVNRVFPNGVKDPSPDLCAANMLYTWAKFGAMTQILPDEPSAMSQSQKKRMWNLLGISMTYFANPHVQARAAHIQAGRRTKDQIILDWFTNLSLLVVDEITATERLIKHHPIKVVNTYFYRGFSILPTALLTHNQALLNRSRAVFNAAVGQITYGQADADADDGFLPNELRRQSKAGHYTAYASFPIVGMAAVSRSYGCDFMNTHGSQSRITRLLEKAIQGFYDPSVFEKRTGYVQDPSADPRLTMVLVNRFPDANMSKSIASFVYRTTGEDSVAGQTSHTYFGGPLSRVADQIDLRHHQSIRGFCGH